MHALYNFCNCFLVDEPLPGKDTMNGVINQVIQAVTVGVKMTPLPTCFVILLLTSCHFEAKESTLQAEVDGLCTIF